MIYPFPLSEVRLMNKLWFLPLVLLTGCASLAGYAGSHPAAITCKGKGAVTGQGTVPVAGGSFSIQADCGDGFEYRQTGDPK